MLTNLQLLAISFVVAYGIYSALLYQQRYERKPTISHHAAKNKATVSAYIFVQLVAATTFYIFALRYFPGTQQAGLIISVATIGYISDIIQGFIPARGEAEKYHTFFAYIMAISVIIIGILAAFTIPQAPLGSLISKILAICLLLSIPASQIIDAKYFYRIQMAALLIFYVELFVIVAAL